MFADTAWQIRILKAFCTGLLDYETTLHRLTWLRNEKLSKVSPGDIMFCAFEINVKHIWFWPARKTHLNFKKEKKLFVKLKLYYQKWLGFFGWNVTAVVSIDLKHIADLNGKGRVGPK